MPMSLYIRVQNSFWTHRKTIRLRAKIGDAALWIPPRLWSYAADNQPDGDFSDYSADELAMLIGYTSNASSMLQALQEAGFMDEMQIHDWQEHNAYHEKYADRAKKAAKERWDKQKGKGQDKKGNDKKGKEASIPSSNACSIDANALVLEIEKPRVVSQQPLPFDSPTFAETWAKWKRHRSEIKKPLKPTMESAQLDELKAMGEARAIAALNHTISKGWQGIREPEPQLSFGGPPKPIKPTDQSDVNPANIRSL